jgi:DNA polymerase III delta prime subunit
MMSILPTKKSKPKSGMDEFNWIIYGPPKIGKTTLATHFPGALFLATEDGQGAHGCYRVPIASWASFLDACKELAAGKHEFKTIIVDTVDNLWELCSAFICAKRGIEHESELEYGKGFQLVQTEFFRVLTRLSMLPFGLVLISHSVEVEIETRVKKYTKSIPSFKRKQQSRLLGMADFILYCDFASVKAGDGQTTYQRVIRTKAAEAYTAGDRTGKMPDPLPLSFAKLNEAFTAAIKGDK